MATKLHIPAPCHEKWSEMTAVRHDCRHCAVCEKSVVDFTLKTDAEIQEILRQNSGKVCGRFRADQLERPLLATRPTTWSRRTGSSWSIAASVAAMLSVNQVAAQQPASPVATEQTPTRADVSSTVKPSHNQEHDSIRVVSGKIIHRKSRKPISDCSVTIVGVSYRTWARTDENGIFSLKIPLKEMDEKALVLRLKLWGYEAQDVELPERAKSEDLAMLPIRYKLKEEKRVFIMGCPAFMP